MITDERIASFINSFNNDYDDAITAIRKEARSRWFRKENAQLSVN